jgi:glycosyltransferase involved in cell wall biosynthesis
MITLYINGKFTAQRTTGVQRVAQNLLQALDAVLLPIDADPPIRTVILLPRDAPEPSLKHIEVSRLGPRLPLHLWEQCLLPLAAHGGLLLNLSGSAPLLARRQVCLMHDAAVFDCPQAYARAFRLWYRTLFRLLPRLGAMLLTVSEFSRQRLALRLGIAASRLGVVPDGGDHLRDVVADASVLGRLGVEPGSYFVAVGSANPNKNLDVLCAAFGRLRAGQGVKLVIVGAADARVFADCTPATGSGAANIVAAGPIDDGALKALYQHATALIFPSLYEGFGLPPLEAMSCGCPVAASNAAAIPEVCGDAALYFDPASTAQIIIAMQRLLDEPALRERLRRAGALRVQRYTWDGSAQLLQGFLRAALATQGSAA